MQDTQNVIDLDPELALETVDSWIDGAVALAPAMIAALAVFIIGWVMTTLVRAIIVGRLKKRGRRDLGLMLGGLIKGVGLVGFGLIALSIVVPSIRPGDLVAGLGIGSVAIGFAFKDILQNWLAGFLILLRQPFSVGDTVTIGDHTGKVEHIETRSTRVKTFDGMRAIIPNSEVYTNSVVVKTAFEHRRSHYDIGIGYADDIDEATASILKAVKSVDGVETDPGPQVLAWDLAASWVTLRARWWTSNERADIVQTYSDVIRAVKLALDADGVDMPYNTQVHLFHDQTEEVDGDRDAQREGWPSAGETIKPRWKVEKEKEQEEKKSEEKQGTMHE